MPRPDTSTGLNRREFVSRAAIVGAASIAPFSFVRSATARNRQIEEFVKRKFRDANIPGLAVAVIRGEQVV